MKKCTYLISSVRHDRHLKDPWTEEYTVISVQELIPYFINWAAENQVIFNIPKVKTSECMKIQLIGHPNDIQTVMFNFIKFAGNNFIYKKVLF